MTQRHALYSKFHQNRPISSVPLRLILTPFRPVLIPAAPKPIDRYQKFSILIPILIPAIPKTQNRYQIPLQYLRKMIPTAEEHPNRYQIERRREAKMIPTAQELPDRYQITISNHKKNDTYSAESRE